MKSLVVVPEKFLPHRAGQHYELCMPGENVIRKYSVVSPEHVTDFLEFGIQLISNGALSPRLWSLAEGDEIEIRGPIGESFVWDSSRAHSLVLVGAGSGITPLLSMYYSYKEKYPEGECVFIVSGKNKSRIMHYDSLAEILVTRFTGTEGRIDFEFLKKNISSLAGNSTTRCYICGPDNFIDDMVDMVLELGIAEDNIRSERFI